MMRNQEMLLVLVLTVCFGLSAAAHAGVVYADVAADYRVGALGQTSADVGIADTAGDGSWNYYQSNSIIMSEATASALLVVKNTLGLMDPTGYGGNGNYDLPAIADAKFFADSFDPAANELACHASNAAAGKAVFRWTAGPSSAGSVKISGYVNEQVVGGGAAKTDSITFHIVVNDVIVYEVFPTDPLADHLLYAAFDVDVFVSAGDTVDFVVTHNVHFGADETLLSAVIESSLPSAHTPVPEDGITVVSNDVLSTTSVSWYSPLQDEAGNAVVDPNIVSVEGYDVWWSVGTEPNYITDSPTYQAAPDQDYTPTVAITYDTVYYWRVDTYATFDSNEFTGTDSLSGVIQGATWTFTTEPEYLAPVIDTYDSVITTVNIGAGNLSATVTGNSEPLNTPVFTLLTDDAEFPAGSDALLSPTTIDNQNPTATLTTSVAGTYKVKLEVSDGTTTREALAEVVVYADACQAQKAAPSGWTANQFDLDGNCLVDLLDFVAVAAAWLDDTSMDAQESYEGLVGYIPLDVFNNRIEGEWVDPNDPNAFSNFPITDTTGIRINAGYPDTTSGGLCLTHATAVGGVAAFVVYDIDVPAAAAGNAIDVYFAYSNGYAVPSTLTFGSTDGTLTYGTVSLSPTGGWPAFTSGIASGQLTFTTDGPQQIKITFNEAVNLDWFSFVF